MFLSRLQVNLGSNPDRPRPGRLWLRNVYRVHQRLCMAFPTNARKDKDPQFLAPYTPEDFPEQRHLADQCATAIDPKRLAHVHAQRHAEAGFLFRIDPLRTGCAVILVQSAAKPDWDYAFHNAMHLLAAPAETKPFAPAFRLDQHLRFRLKANPTKKIATLPKAQRLAGAPKRHGRRVPVGPTEDDLREWLDDRAKRCGFRLSDELTIQPGYVYVSKSEGPTDGWRYRSAVYDGILQVANPSDFGRSLACGIGPAKAFGFGLLSVAPA